MEQFTGTTIFSNGEEVKISTTDKIAFDDLINYQCMRDFMDDLEDYRKEGLSVDVEWLGNAIDEDTDEV